MNVWKRFNSQEGLSFSYPPSWTIDAPTNEGDTAIAIRSPGDEIGDQNITITSQLGSRSDVLNNPNPSMSVLTSTIEQHSGLSWHIFVSQESDTGIQYLTALSEANGWLYQISAKNNSQAASVLEQILDTIRLQ